MKIVALQISRRISSNSMGASLGVCLWTFAAAENFVKGGEVLSYYPCETRKLTVIQVLVPGRTLIRGPTAIDSRA